MIIDNKFCGKSYVIEDTTTYIKRDGPLLDFKAYERPGLSAMKCDKTPDGKYIWSTLRTLNKREDLKPGDEVLFDWPFGGTIRLTVNADVTWAEGDGLSTALEFHEGWPADGIPPEWTGGCFINNKALLRVKFD